MNMPFFEMGRVHFFQDLFLLGAPVDSGGARVPAQAPSDNPNYNPKITQNHTKINPQRAFGWVNITILKNDFYNL